MKNFKNLEDGSLIRLEHRDFGVWYFTSLTQIVKALGVSPCCVYSTLVTHNEYNGWVADIVDGADVPYKYINPKRI